MGPLQYLTSTHCVSQCLILYRQSNTKNQPRIKPAFQSNITCLTPLYSIQIRAHTYTLLYRPSLNSRQRQRLWLRNERQHQLFHRRWPRTKRRPRAPPRLEQNHRPRRVMGPSRAPPTIDVVESRDAHISQETSWTPRLCAQRLGLG